MKKFILIALTVLLVLGLAATSMAAISGSGQGNGRLVALGLANFQTTDLANKWVNPAYVVNYKNTAWGFLGSYTTAGNTYGAESDNSTTAWGGAHFELPVGVLGIWIDRPSTDATIDRQDNAVSGTGMLALSAAGLTDSNGAAIPALTGLSNPGNNIDLFYGMDMGAALVGLRLNLNVQNSDTKTDAPVEAEPLQAANRYTLTDKSEVVKARDLAVQLGVVLKDIPVGASVIIGMPKAEDTGKVEDKLEADANANNIADTTTATTTEDKIETDSAMNLGVYVNGGLKMSDKTTLVPTVYFESKKNNSKRSSSYAQTVTTGDSLAAGTTTTTLAMGSTREDKETNIGLDAAFNVKPDDSTLLVAALGVASTSTDVTLLNEVTTGTQVAAGVTTYIATPQGTQNDLEVKMSQLAVPYALGVENKTWSRVTTRLGIKGNLYQRTKTTTTSVSQYFNAADNPQKNIANTTTTTETVVSGNLPISVNMGFSVKVGEKVGLTAVLNKDILFSGGYLVSGVPETLSTIVSVAYKF